MNELAAQIHLSICRHWTATLRGPYDWGEHPLGAYILTDEFLESMSKHTQRSLRKATWVCTMLACGRVQALHSLGARQRSGDRDGEALVRSDGASGWECPLSGSCSDSRLRYWIHTDGTVEFDALLGADPPDLAPPPGTLSRPCPQPARSYPPRATAWTASPRVRSSTRRTARRAPRSARSRTSTRWCAS